MKKLITTIILLLQISLVAQWEIVHKNKWEYFTSLDLVNDTLGFATANDGQIVKTNDGGQTWAELQNPPTSHELSIQIDPADPERLYA